MGNGYGEGHDEHLHFQMNHGITVGHFLASQLVLSMPLFMRCYNLHHFTIYWTTCGFTRRGGDPASSLLTHPMTKIGTKGIGDVTLSTIYGTRINLFISLPSGLPVSSLHEGSSLVV